MIGFQKQFFLCIDSLNGKKRNLSFLFQGILRLLKMSPLTFSEIVGYFNLSQSNISHHLSILKAADLVKNKRQGQNVLYTLVEGARARVDKALEDIFGKQVPAEESR